METNQSLFSALWLEKMVTAIFVSFIVGVAALNIVANQIMIVMQKTRDIAILRSMGATARSIMLVFMLQGSIIGTLGTAVGAALGVGSADSRHLPAGAIPRGVPSDSTCPSLLAGDLARGSRRPADPLSATLYPAKRACGSSRSKRCV
jgi:lipoprotein-releasing system permease protein